jgi:hypothetical protein
MGREVEEPIRALVEQGSQAVYEHVQREGPLRVFVWLALIFLKIHLKDRTLRWHRDLRLPDDRIGDLHSWEELHHLHTVARCLYTHCAVSSRVTGSLLVMSAKNGRALSLSILRICLPRRHCSCESMTLHSWPFSTTPAALCRV